MREPLSGLKKAKKFILVLCDGLELIGAGLMLIGILFSIFSLITNTELFGRLLTDTSAFKQYLDQIFMLVIGIEFLVMLCKPSSENVIEVLIFLVARHMIVGDTTPYQDFASVFSVALLCVVRRYLRINRENREEKKHGTADQEQIEEDRE